MNKYLKTAIVFFYLQLVFLPFAYLIGLVVFESTYWPLNEWETVDIDGRKIVITVFLLVESLYLYLSIKY